MTDSPHDVLDIGPEGERFRLSGGPIRTDDRLYVLAFAIALFFHILPVAVEAGLWRFVPGLAGAPLPKPERLGDPKGALDGVNVEIIDASEYDKRFVSFTNGRDAGLRDSVDAKKATPQQPQAEAPKEEPQPPEPNPEAPASRLTQAEIEKILNSARSELEDFAEATSKASLAAQGNASPAMRAIMRKLKQTMPNSQGQTGILVVNILLNEDASVRSVTLGKSSGNSRLDQLVIDRVRSTPLGGAGVHLAPDERSLQITYEYL